MQSHPLRPSRIEIDLAQLRRNLELINQDKGPDVGLVAVVKDEAYGHGAVEVAKTALASGAKFLGLVTLDEALALRAAGISAPILMLSARPPQELPYCIEHSLTCCVGDVETASKLNRLAEQQQKIQAVHIKINTGMNRFGMRADDAAGPILEMSRMPYLRLDGIMSHFSMSDELDKSFAELQLSRFNTLLEQLLATGISFRYRHICNSGGLLDLPCAHFDLVRTGILSLGVYPSSVCRRIPGIEAVMSVKTQISFIQNLRPGDKVGYGMRFTADSPRRVAVLPIGYGDGFPRVRNEGFVLIHKKRAPIIGGVAMDATVVDITDIPEAQLWDEVVIMGKQGNETITAHELAALKKTVSYEVLTNWRWRLPRVYSGKTAPVLR